MSGSEQSTIGQMGLQNGENAGLRGDMVWGEDMLDHSILKTVAQQVMSGKAGMGLLP
jgi:hypothetical protein